MVRVDNFDEILVTPPVVPLAMNDSMVRALREDDAFWYANKKPLRQQPKKRFFEEEWFRTLMWFLMVGSFAAIIVWFLASSDITLFRKKQVRVEDTGAEEEHVSENIFDINFEKAIEKAIAAGDYNLAIRLYYLQALKFLSARQLITYAQDRTNSEYVSQLYGTPYYRDFFRLTREFEYAWYGRFLMDEPMFRAVQQTFEAFKTKMAA